MRRFFLVHMQDIRVVASVVVGMLYVLVVSLTRDGHAVPGQGLSRNNIDRVAVGNRHTFLQDRRHDTVAVILHARQRVNNRFRLRIGLAFPFVTTAERDRANDTRNGVNRQDQLIDTVLIRFRTVLVEIMDRLTYTLSVQFRTTSPIEAFVLANRHVLDEMIRRLILGQYQAVGIVTTRRLVMRCMFVHTCLIDRIRLRLAVQDVLPVVRMGPIQHTRLQVHLTRMLHDRDTISCIRRIYVLVLACVDVRLAVERQTLIVAQREQRIYICMRLHRQVHTVNTVAPVNGVEYTLVVTGFVQYRIAPYQRIAGVDTLVLRLVEHRIHVHVIHLYHRVALQCTRRRRDDSVVDDRVRPYLDFTRTHLLDRVTRTYLVTLCLTYVERRIGIRYCCQYQQHATCQSIEIVLHILSPLTVNR